MTVQDLTMKPFADDFRASLRLCASSVSILAARDQSGGRHGMAVSSAGSLSMEPPSMLVAVNRSASLHPVILQTGRFSLNLLGEQHVELLERFSRSDMRDRRFATDAWAEGLEGTPVLRDALCAHVCKVSQRHDFGTHSVFFGIVEDVIVSVRPDRHTPPILWVNGARASVSMPSDA